MIKIFEQQKYRNFIESPSIRIEKAFHSWTLKISLFQLSSKISHRLILIYIYSISSGGYFKYNLDDNGGSPLSSFQAFFKFDPDEEY